MDFDETTAPAFTGTDLHQLIEKVAAQNGGYPTRVYMNRETYERLVLEAGDDMYFNAHERFDRQGLVGRYIGTPIYIDDEIHGGNVFVIPANDDKPVRVVYGNIGINQQGYIVDTVDKNMIITDARYVHETDEVVYTVKNGDQEREIRLDDYNLLNYDGNELRFIPADPNDYLTFKYPTDMEFDYEEYARKLFNNEYDAYYFYEEEAPEIEDKDFLDVIRS